MNEAVCKMLIAEGKEILESDCEQCEDRCFEISKEKKTMTKEEVMEKYDAVMEISKDFIGMDEKIKKENFPEFWKRYYELEDAMDAFYEAFKEYNKQFE